VRTWVRSGPDAEEIKRHPKLTYDILSRVGPFRPIAETTANHHEKLDGSGYHRGIGAEDLDFPSRILAVADIYDALSADRSYHEAMPQERVLGILREESATRTDPQASPSSKTWPPKTGCKGNPDGPPPFAPPPVPTTPPGGRGAPAGRLRGTGHTQGRR
jgi:hypothetical protein